VEVRSLMFHMLGVVDYIAKAVWMRMSSEMKLSLLVDFAKQSNCYTSVLLVEDELGMLTKS